MFLLTQTEVTERSQHKIIYDLNLKVEKSRMKEGYFKKMEKQKKPKYKYDKCPDKTKQKFQIAEIRAG